MVSGHMSTLSPDKQCWGERQSVLDAMQKGKNEAGRLFPIAVMTMNFCDGDEASLRR